MDAFGNFFLFLILNRKIKFEGQIQIIFIRIEKRNDSKIGLTAHKMQLN